MSPNRSGRLVPKFMGDQQVTDSGYDAESLARLQAIKRNRDPLGTIRSNKAVLMTMK